MKRAALGIDIGGTKTLFVLVDDACTPLHDSKFKTAPTEGRRQFTTEFLGAAREMVRYAKKQDLEICSVGVGCAGTMDPEKARILSSPNILSLEGYSIGKQLAKVIDVPVRLENDVRMGLYGEYKMGAARGGSSSARG